MGAPTWQVEPGTTYLIRQPTGHPIHENWRVELFRQLLMLPDLGPEQLKLLGEIMYQVLTLLQPPQLRLSYALQYACFLQPQKGCLVVLWKCSRHVRS